MTEINSETGRGRRQMVRRSIAERERLLAEFDKLGISQAEFARRKAIKYATFSYWCQARQKRKNGALVEVVHSPAPKTTEVEVDLPGDIHVRVRYEGGLSELAILVAELRGSRRKC